MNESGNVVYCLCATGIIFILGALLTVYAALCAGSRADDHMPHRRL